MKAARAVRVQNLLLVCGLISCFFMITNCSNAHQRPGEAPREDKPLGTNELRSYQAWGERPSSCKDDKDWYRFTIPAEFVEATSKNILQKKKYFSFFNGDSCLRVGTEVELHRPVDESSGREQKSLVARIFINRISVLGEEAVVRRMGDLPSRADLYLNQLKNKSSSNTLVEYEVVSRFYNMTLNQEGQRSQNCPAYYFDWRKFYLDKEGFEESLEKLKEGKTLADIWNGGFNCFRVGKEAKILLRRDEERNKSYGRLLIEEVAMLHISDLTDELIALTGRKKDELLAELSEKKQRDGGYLSLVRFSFSPEPDEDPENKKEVEP